jgi:hypothetical protein
MDNEAPTDPYVYPTRYWECIERIDATMRTMTEEELVGAYKIMKKVSDYFWLQHFEKFATLNQRSIVKTLDDLSENMCHELQCRAKVEQLYRKTGGGGPRHYFPS